MRFRKTIGSDGSIRYSTRFIIRPDALVPPAPPKNLPDGSLAREEEMIAAMHKYRVYNSDVEAYLRRLEFEERCGRLTRSMRNRLHNAAIDALQLNVGKFNLQVRIFRARGHFRLAAGSDLRH